MAESVEIVVLDDFLPEIAAALPKLGGLLAKQKADMVAALAASNHAYQDQTGQASSGFYVVTRDSSTYGQGFIGGSGKDGEEMLPEIDHPTDEETAIVSNASGHFLFLEMGTSRMPAFPSLTPAAEVVAQTFGNDDWEALIAKALGL
jgi:hypothetical protein